MRSMRPVGFEPTTNIINNRNVSSFQDRFGRLASVVTVTIIMLFAMQSFSCSSSDSPPPAKIPYQGDTVVEWTIKGDSMGNGLAKQWDGAENDAVDGMSVFGLIQYPDERALQKVVIFAGINDLASGLPVKDTLDRYYELYHSLNAEKIYCIAIPNTEMYYNLITSVLEFNDGLMSICGDGYIETWDIPFTSDDTLHPDDEMNAIIMDRILAHNDQP